METITENFDTRADLRALYQLREEVEREIAEYKINARAPLLPPRLNALNRVIKLLEGIRSGWEVPEKVTSTERPAAPWFAIQMGKPAHDHLDFFVMDTNDRPVARILVLDNPIGRLIAQLLVRAEDVAQLLATLLGVAEENEIRTGVGLLGVVRAMLRTVGIEK